ncbi:MAG: T9SS type A sorting domain-containing protein [Flavobacteriales bacterium]|jgi:hypothetical protein
MKKLFITLFAIVLNLALSAQLTQTNGPLASGISYCVYADDEVVFVAQSSRFYKSTDGGDSFIEVAIDESFDDTNFGIDPRLVLRIGDVFICATNQADRIYRSTDMGNTWTSSWTGTPDISGFPAAVVTGGIVKDDTFIIWGTNLYRYSNDLGLTWQSYPTLTPGSGEGLANVNGRLWVGAYNYTGYSDDNGATWTECATDPHIGFGISARDFVQIGDRTYAGTSSAGNQALKYTTDNGNTWVSVSAALSIISDLEYIDGVFYAYCYNGLFRSLDDGETWEQYLAVSQPGYGATFDIVGDKLWIATNAGPRCFDISSGTTFAPPIIGGNVGWVLQGQDYIYAGSGNNISVSTNNGETWSSVTLPSSTTAWGNVTYATIDGNTLYLSHSIVNNAPGVIYTSDGGATWNALNTASFNGSNPAIFYSFNPQIVICSQWFVISYYYSNDDGATWQQATVSAAPGSTLPSSYSVSVLHRVGSRLILSTNSGHAISNDNGQTWTFVQPGFNLTNFSGWDNRIVAVENHWSGKRIHESTDGGLTWTQVNGAFPTHADGKINPVAMTNVGNTIVCQNVPLDDTVINPRYIYTMNQNGDWTAAPELGVVPHDITMFNGSGLDNFVVSTNGGGVWSNAGGVGLSEIKSELNWTIYPNPANDEITIAREDNSAVRYHIFSSSGALVQTGMSNAIQERISLDRLPQGMYHVVLQGSNGASSSRGMVKN